MWLCRPCIQGLPPFSQRCIVCNSPRPRGATCARHGKNPALAGVVSAGAYTWDCLRRGVHWLKFRGVTDVAPPLAELLLPYLPFIASPRVLQQEAVLVPIPLHRWRQRQRGFNQSWLIAQALSEKAGIAVAQGLKKTHATRAQTDLPHEMRRENIAQAFVAAEPLPNKRYVLLVDDVTTTGSTLASAAEVLERPGREIWGVTVARG